MERVVVIGPPGSGKSTVARALGSLLDLPVVHLDTLFWNPGWVESDPDDFDARVRVRIRDERWVIDGNYQRTLAERMARADRIVFLDLPRRLCLSQIVLRRVRYARRERPDMAPGCPERIDREFWTWARGWHANSRARKLPLIAAHADKVEILRSRREIRAFLAALARDGAAT